MLPAGIDLDLFRAMFASLLADATNRAELEKGIADWFRNKHWDAISIYETSPINGGVQGIELIHWGSPEVIAYNLLEMFSKHVTD